MVVKSPNSVLMGYLALTSLLFPRLFGKIHFLSHKSMGLVPSTLVGGLCGHKFRTLSYKEKEFLAASLVTINCQNLKIHTAGTRARRWPLRSAPWLACFHFKKACDYHQKQHKRFPHFKCRGPTEDIIMYFTLMSQILT